MGTVDVWEMIKNKSEDPSFSVNGIHVGRGALIKEISTKNIIVWKIVGDNLVLSEKPNVFLQSETFLIQWNFEYCPENGTNIEKTLFFYWKGSNAKKGLCPLPENFTNDIAIVNRIVQWSEPTIFFHIFPKQVIALINNINPFVSHMFMIRGELQNELHIYEIPHCRRNLRSRGCYLITVPNENTIYLWIGSKVTKSLIKLIKELDFEDILENIHISWKNFVVLELNEGERDKEIDLFSGDLGEYLHVKQDCNFSPRLFYLKPMDNTFLVIEIEYPLRSSGVINPFPFLQSHLNTEEQTDMFILDNNSDVWLIWKEQDDSPNVDVIKTLAEKTATEYVKAKQDILKRDVKLKITQSDSTNIEFTNLFPMWE